MQNQIHPNGGYPPSGGYGYPPPHAPLNTYGPSYGQPPPYDSQPGYAPPQTQAGYGPPPPQPVFNQYGYGQPLYNQTGPPNCHDQNGQPLTTQTIIVNQPAPQTVYTRQPGKDKSNKTDSGAACCAGMCAGMACCCLLDSCDDCDLGDCDMGD